MHYSRSPRTSRSSRLTTTFWLNGYCATRRSQNQSQAPDAQREPRCRRSSDRRASGTCRRAPRGLQRRTCRRDRWRTRSRRGRARFRGPIWRSDTITDFIPGVDHLVLSAFCPKPLADGGSLLALNFGHPLAAGDLLYSEASNDDSGTLWYNTYDHTLYAIEGTTSAIDDG